MLWFFPCKVQPFKSVHKQWKTQTLIIHNTCEFILFGSLKNYSNLSGFLVAFISTYQTEFPPPFVASSLYRGSCLS
jgi:hypothetical protein